MHCEHSLASLQPIFLGITYFILFSFVAHKVPRARWYDDLQERRSHAMDLIYYEVKYIIMKNSCSYSSSLQGISAPLWMTAHTVSSIETNGGEMAAHSSELEDWVPLVWSTLDP